MSGQTVLVDGALYRINGTRRLDARGETWADAEKKMPDGDWYPVQNWERRAELGRLADGGA